MLPSVVATQIRSCVADYLLTTFRPTTIGFTGLLERFLEHPDHYYRGPYVSIGLPFRPGDIGPNFFPNIPLSVHPHLHQEQAWQRLQPPTYQSTLIATGTGSGKTECFLLPLLEHCYQTRGTPGIKAIIIYPMNALATDQAKRIAELIYTTPALQGQITAGLYIGEQDETPTRIMGPDKVITDKTILRQAPPDILLTNYKMLDYLLIQPDVQTLWQQNQPETLRYLIVDEFHTFDGAQGTDLACLLRRLKHRLKTPQHHLACVGTSATLGSDTSAMLSYATKVFAEPFTETAVIAENRISPHEFLYGDEGELTVLPIPRPEQLAELVPSRYPNPTAYLEAQAQLWLHHLAPQAPILASTASPESPQRFELNPEWQIQLGQELKGLPIVHNLIRLLSQAPQPYPDLIERLTPRLGLPTTAPSDYYPCLLDSLFSLMAVARRSLNTPNHAQLVLPWVTLRFQVWFRELRRMVASVESTPELLFSTDLTNSPPGPGERPPPKNLPIVHCRDCGATGWGGIRSHQGASRLEICDLKPFYQAYFNQSPLLSFIFPCEANVPERWLLCGQCLTLNAHQAKHCSCCGHRELIPVQVPDTSCDQTENGQTQRITSRDCPYCNSPSGLAIVGAQAASLTSAMIGVLFTTPFNTDKKLITFSDSVQDAAHRAGFYSARTYRTTLRTAIAQTIQTLPNLNLQALIQQFPTYWQSQLGTETDYVATFLPNDLAWLREWDQYVQSDGLELSPESTLVRLVNQRLAWEIVNQFGHRSAVGASLERSAICATYFESNALSTATDSLHHELSNQFEPLRHLPPETTRQFILGILHHLRQRGGLLQPATEPYIENGGNTYLWSKLLYMPSIGPGVPRPIFFATAAAQANGFEVVFRSSNNTTWCADWATRCFGDTTLLLTEQLGDILNLTLEELVQAGLLEKRSCAKSQSKTQQALHHGLAWGIPLSALQLESGGTVLTCSHCRHQITASQPEYPSLIGMICLNRGCIGTYQVDQRTGLAYYRDIYRYGQVERINANEHTGLLSRPNRETLEHRFIQNRRRCDPNLISATSTLEMGINIGNLSSIVLCSVPPGPANYQQRIGRAGRRDGNALTSVVANGKPHDLYFYANPLKMLNGTVEAAGCYLDASAILQRQLTAFCLDHWVATSLPRNALPAKLNDVLNTLERQNLQAFPYTWLDYVKQHQHQLLTEFLSLFSETTSSRTQDELRQFMEKGEMEQGGLRFRVLNALEGIRRERTRLSSQISGLGTKLKKLREQPDALQDPERIEELQREQKGFRELRKQLNQKQTLNFFTDEGLLPNYAFPEAGVTLRSILWRKRETKDHGDGKKYETYPITYERPGQVAIRELVPNGVFYAEGRKVTIDQIDLNLTEPEDWRFCRSCHYASRTIEPEAQARVCPRCHDPVWSDHGQVRRMLRLKQVMATTSDRESRFGDDSDVRNPAFFQRHLLVDFKPEFRLKTYLIKDNDIPFGFEYIERTSFRELNLGEPQRQGESLHIAGREFKSPGFAVCRSCGKVMRGHSRKDHTIGCQYWDKPDQAKAMDVLYLYREFESEAIRFLMPDENFWTPPGLHSFVAALQLGLKQKFGGQVSHLHTAIAEEPQANSTLRKSFLYLYDSVPGGTGYLRQLIRNPAEMRDVFQQSLRVIRACRCQEEGKDGCYECLFAYRTSFDLDQTSRKKAQTLLSTVLNQWDSLQKTSDGLASIRLNANFDSELERRFIDALQADHPTNNGPRPQLRKDIFNGKTGYYLEIGDISWIIETQVRLNERFGVDVPSEADFLIRPASKHNQSKPIAIFTDGWQYHEDRITQDIQQRLAIIRSQQFWCWSLTWDDIPHQSESQKKSSPPIGLTCQLNLQFQNNPGLHQKYQCEALSGLDTQNSFVWLMHYLAHPNQTLWTHWALLRTLAQADPRTLQQPALSQAWSQTLSQLLGPDPLQLWQPETPIMTNTIAINDSLKIWLGLDLKRHQAQDSAGSLVLLELNPNLTSTETFKLAWQEALRLKNLYQFLPNFYAITDDHPVDIAPPQSTHSASLTPGQTPLNPAWASLRELVLDESLLPIINLMAEQQWPLPEIGYELTAPNGQVIADAELAWVSPKIAILLEPDSKQIWQKQGWFTQTVTELIQSPEVVQKKLKES